MAGEVQQSGQLVRVIAHGADRTDAEAFGLRRDDEGGEGYRRIDCCVEERIEMVIGKMPAAQCMDLSLTTIVAAEDYKIWYGLDPFLPKRSGCQERPDLSSQGWRVDDDDVALL